MKQPLAYKLRPKQIDEFIGQSHLFHQNSIITKMIEKDEIQSMIFYGPPGCGKTSTALYISEKLNKPARFFNAVTGTKKDLDAIYLESKMSSGIILIIDEIHRLNKDKQDTLLPYLEEGLILLIGTTTSNPYFAINPAIRSRVFLIEFTPLTNQDILTILENALTSEKGYQNKYQVEDKLLNTIVTISNGDARNALNLLQLAILNSDATNVTLDSSKALLPKFAITFSKDGSEYYDTLSAFQKSIRGSDVNAALYYLALLILANDITSIERRLLTLAYEDIGLANPSLISRVLNAIESAKRIGFPEARIPLSVIVIELCLSPKSKSGELAIDAAIQTAQTTPAQMPQYLKLKPVTQSKDYQYQYDDYDLYHKLQYLPDALKETEFYKPMNLNSIEKTYAENYNKLKSIKRAKNPKKGSL